LASGTIENTPPTGHLLAWFFRPGNPSRKKMTWMVIGTWAKLAPLQNSHSVCRAVREKAGDGKLFESERTFRCRGNIHEDRSYIDELNLHFVLGYF
jgi:hypothetical protein